MVDVGAPVAQVIQVDHVDREVVNPSMVEHYVENDEGGMDINQIEAFRKI